MEKGAGAEKMTTTEERSGEKRKEESWRGLNVRDRYSLRECFTLNGIIKSWNRISIPIN
jgi:hypothetical protein